MCVRLAALRTHVCFRGVAVGGRCCVARVLWVAAAVADSPCYALVRLVSCAVSHCCSVGADSDCNTVVEVLCVPPGVAALDAAAWCCGRVFNAAPPLCVTTVLTSTLSVQCSGVCSCGAACMFLSDCRWQQCVVVSVCCCIAVLLRCCVALGSLARGVVRER